MRTLSLLVWLIGLAAYSSAAANDIPRSSYDFSQTGANPSDLYYWHVRDTGNSIQLVTLFCKSFGAKSSDVPVLAVLRDNLGDLGDGNSRLTYVWLLTYTPLDFEQRLAAAVPFFSWHIGEPRNSANLKPVRPLMNVAAQQPVLATGIGRALLQWTMLDANGTPLRASSRSYQMNALDHERSHIEEAISYLREAPPSGNGLSREEANVVIARLQLREHLLGDFASDALARRAAQQDGFDEQRIRSRNFELLRQCAEKTGLEFEPLPIAGTSDDYAMLAFSPASAAAQTGIPLGPVWKLLNIRDPRSDERIKKWDGPFIQRTNRNGAVERLIPLGVYSMDYPKMPLLLVDFRSNLQIRRRELTQRYINEATAGVIGVSHFTNWYYFVGCDLYDFVSSRHGGALDQAARLDSYARFRSALALDTSLDASLRTNMLRRAQVASMNPLECSPEKEAQLARERFAVLEREANDGRLLAKVDKERREEMAAFGRDRKSVAIDVFLRNITLGFYTPRVSSRHFDPNRLAAQRLMASDLAFLKTVADSGPMPEVTYDPGILTARVRELGSLAQQLNVPTLTRESQSTIKRVADASKDPFLQANCLLALRSINPNPIRLANATVATGSQAETGE